MFSSDSLGQAPIIRTLLKQILPAVLAQAVNLLYNLADTYFVGLLNNPTQTATLTVVYSSTFLITAIANLFGVGGASLVARLLGKDDREGARKVASVCIYFSLLSGVAFSAVYGFLEEIILTLCGATEEILSYAIEYNLYVIVLGGPFAALNIVCASLIRAEGRAFVSSFGTSLGCLLNIFLDPFFVLPRFLGLHAAGAGMATLIANIASLLFFVVYISANERTVVDFDIRNLKSASLYFADILKIGLTASLQYALTFVAISAQAKFVSKYSTEAAAALGIVKKLDQLPLDFTIGVSNGLLPFIAYNYSAGNEERRKKAFVYGVVVTFTFSALCLVVYEIFAPSLARIFIKDAITVGLAAAFLRRLVVGMPVIAVVYPLLISFQAMGRAKSALAVSLLRKGLLDIPLLFLMDSLVPLYGWAWVQLIVDCVALTVGVILYNFKRKKQPVL